jgi:hypothetical protein
LVRLWENRSDLFHPTWKTSDLHLRKTNFPIGISAL